MTSLIAGATVCPDGTPNLSPKGTIAIWDDDHLVFADIRSPGIITNIKNNPAVELNVVDPFVRKGYRFKGVGEVVTDGERFQEIVRFYRGLWVDTARSSSESRIRAFVVVKSKQCCHVEWSRHDGENSHDITDR